MEPTHMTMDMDELLHLAYAVQNHDATPILVFTFEELQQFAQVIAENEREACANVADVVAREIDDTNGTATYIAKAIRARGSE